MKPKVDAVEKVKPGPINDKNSVCLVVGSEKDCGGKYSLEALHDAVISLAVFEEMEEVKYLGRGAEAHDPAALANRHGRHPDRNEPVLAVREAKLRVAYDLKKEFTVAPCVDQLSRWRATEGKAAKNKRAGVKSKFLGAMLTLLAYEQHVLHLPDASFADSDRGQDRLKGNGRMACACRGR
jgi:hypothetical protein